jgi:hypothetical protein
MIRLKARDETHTRARAQAEIRPYQEKTFSEESRKAERSGTKSLQRGLKRWENMSEDARKLEPELHPDNFKSYLVEGEIK